MTGEKFTLMQYSINAILGLIEAEDFVIPEIQRPFVWKRSQVRDLILKLTKQSAMMRPQHISPKQNNSV